MTNNQTFPRFTFRLELGDICTRYSDSVEIKPASALRDARGASSVTHSAILMPRAGTDGLLTITLDGTQHVLPVRMGKTERMADDAKPAACFVRNDGTLDTKAILTAGDDMFQVKYRVSLAIDGRTKAVRVVMAEKDAQLVDGSLRAELKGFSRRLDGDIRYNKATIGDITLAIVRDANKSSDLVRLQAERRNAEQAVITRRHELSAAYVQAASKVDMPELPERSRKEERKAAFKARASVRRSLRDATYRALISAPIPQAA